MPLAQLPILPINPDLIIEQEITQIEIVATHPLANQKMTVLTRIQSYLSKKGTSSFVILFGTYSFFFFLFSLLLRKKFISVIPISLFYIAWAFVVIPTFYILKNDKLLKFFAHEIDIFLKSWYYLLHSLKQLKSKVNPYYIECQQ